jgi:hypothetical protein
MTAQAATTFEFRWRGELEVLAWPVFDQFDIDVMVTTRQGGASSGEHGEYATLNLALHVGDNPADVMKNRRRAATALDARPGDFVFCNQVHGRGVHIATGADRGRGAFSLEDAIPDTDALVTRDDGIVLSVMAADCAPIVFYDPGVHVIACVHAGWRGTVARVSEAALAAMWSLGSQPKDVIAGIGPAIAAENYQVGEDVLAAAQKSFGADATSVIWPDGTGKWLFDVWAANRLVLQQSGIRDENIHLAPVPTGPGLGRFFSDRDTRPCGRFAAMAVLRARGGA